MEGKKNFVIGVLITLLLCVIGFCIYLIVDKGNNVKKEEKQTNTEENKTVNGEEEKQNKIDEKVLEDTNIINEINEKIKYVYAGFGGHENFKGNFYKIENWENSKTTESEKVYITLNSCLAASYEKLDNDNYLKEAKKVMPDVVNAEVWSVTSFSALNKAYNNLFGGTINSKNLVNYKNKYYSLKKCVYSRISDIYVCAYTGGGITGGTYTHIDKYTTDDNNVYVYVYVGNWAPTVEGPILYVNDSSKPYATEGNMEEIFNQNYQDFSEYKLTFTYDSKNSNYYFNSLEKLK